TFEVIVQRVRRIRLAAGRTPRDRTQRDSVVLDAEHTHDVGVRIVGREVVALLERHELLRADDDAPRTRLLEELPTGEDQRTLAHLRQAAGSYSEHVPKPRIELHITLMPRAFD